MLQTLIRDPHGQLPARISTQTRPAQPSEEQRRSWIIPDPLAQQRLCLAAAGRWAQPGPGSRMPNSQIKNGAGSQEQALLDVFHTQKSLTQTLGGCSRCPNTTSGVQRSFAAASGNHLDAPEKSGIWSRRCSYVLRVYRSVLLHFHSTSPRYELQVPQIQSGS